MRRLCVIDTPAAPEVPERGIVNRSETPPVGALSGLGENRSGGNPAPRHGTPVKDAEERGPVPYPNCRVGQGNLQNREKDSSGGGFSVFLVKRRRVFEETAHTSYPR